MPELIITSTCVHSSTFTIVHRQHYGRVDLIPPIRVDGASGLALNTVTTGHKKPGFKPIIFANETYSGLTHTQLKKRCLCRNEWYDERYNASMFGWYTVYCSICLFSINQITHGYKCTQKRNYHSNHFTEEWSYKKCPVKRMFL